MSLAVGLLRPQPFIAKHWRSLFNLFALIVDIIVLVISGITALYVGRLYPIIPEFYEEQLLSRWLLFSCTLLFFALILGLYRAAYHCPVRLQYRIAMRCHFYSIVAVFASFYVFHQIHFPRRFSFLFFFFVPVFFLIGRSLLKSFNLRMQKKGYGVVNALVVGYAGQAAEVLERFNKFPELGYKIIGTLSEYADDFYEEHYSFEQVPSLLRQQRIDRIFIPSDNLFSKSYPQLMKICESYGITLKVLSKEADELLKAARVYDLVGITLYSPKARKAKRLKLFFKRAFDLVGATCIVLLISPILLLASIAILIESGRPIIFKQKRSQIRKGEIFYLYKFRSMVKNADEMKERLLAFNESNGALFKIKSDPRVTRVGKFLRKLSIDELPQLFNVLKGEMSLVGPRPLPVEDFENVEEDEEFWEAIKDRGKMQPGITGLWQISGRSNLGFREMVLLDLYYIENQSLLFDLEILLETIPVIFYGRGAY